MPKYYAGIGSRETPMDVLSKMTGIAEALVWLDYTLRSGGAKGADLAFEKGAAHSKEIFVADDCTPEAMRMAQFVHPAWERCGQMARMLHGRNAMIILGRDLNQPVDFVVCYQNPNVDRGGTKLGMAIATAKGIPIYNLALEGQYEKLRAERLVTT
jgi:hypothetical protein